MTTVAHRREQMGCTRLQIEDAMGCEQSIGCYENAMMPWSKTIKDEQMARYMNKLDEPGYKFKTLWVATRKSWRDFNLAAPKLCVCVLAVCAYMLWVCVCVCVCTLVCARVRSSELSPNGGNICMV